MIVKTVVLKKDVSKLFGEVVYLNEVETNLFRILWVKFLGLFG